MDEDPDVSQESVLGIGGVPHELGDPRPVWLGADARDLTAAAGQVNQDQHGEAGQATWRPEDDDDSIEGGVGLRHSRGPRCGARTSVEAPASAPPTDRRRCCSLRESGRHAVLG